MGLQDKIGREEIVDKICGLVDSLGKDKNFSMAINGAWGSGKTFFVRQTKMVINALNPSCDTDEGIKSKATARLPLTKTEQERENFDIAVYYDAWGNDNDTEPVLSLIYEITKQLSAEFSLSDKSIVKMAGSIVEAISGHNVNGIMDALSADDPFTKFKEQKDYFTMKKVIKDWIEYYEELNKN